MRSYTEKFGISAVGVSLRPGSRMAALRRLLSTAYGLGGRPVPGGVAGVLGGAAGALGVVPLGGVVAGLACGAAVVAVNPYALSSSL